MFFWQSKAKEEINTNGLYPTLGELVEQKKYLPYIYSARNNITSCQAGDIRSAFKGRGIDFEEVRIYGFGDDVRDIDWRVTARKGDVYTKVYSEERDREVYVMLDLSSHMLFGTRKELKSVSASKITALLGWQSLASKDRFGVAIFDGKSTRYFKPQNNPKSLMAILKNISNTGKGIIQTSSKEDANSVDLGDALQFLQYNIKGQAMIFIISNFNNITNNTKNKLKALSSRGRIYCVNVYDVIEDIPPQSGEYMAEYLGEKLVFDTTPESFKKAYYHYFAQKRKEMESFCRGIGCQYINIRTDRPLYKQLKIL